MSFDTLNITKNSVGGIVVSIAAFQRTKMVTIGTIQIFILQNGIIDKES